MHGTTLRSVNVHTVRRLRKEVKTWQDQKFRIVKNANTLKTATQVKDGLEVRMAVGIANTTRNIFPGKRYGPVQHGAIYDAACGFNTFSGIDAEIPGIIASSCRKVHLYVLMQKLGNPKGKPGFFPNTWTERTQQNRSF